MPVTAGAYKIFKICKMTGSGLWLPSCCSRVILRYGPTIVGHCCPTTVYSCIMYCSTHGKCSPKFFTLMCIVRARSRARGYGMYGTVLQIHNWPIY